MIMSKTKYSLALHFVCLCAFLAIYFSLGEDNNVRWNLDAALLVGSLFFAVAWLRLTRQKGSNAFVRFYMRLYSIICTPIVFFTLFEIGFWHFRKGEMVAEDSDYIIRKIDQGIIMGFEPDLFKLYEKDGIYERYVTTLDSDGFRYKMTSVRFYKDLSAVSFRFELLEEWSESGQESDTVPFYFVAPIHNEVFNSHLREIDSLKKELNRQEGK